MTLVLSNNAVGFGRVGSIQKNASNNFDILKISEYSKTLIESKYSWYGF